MERRIGLEPSQELDHGLDAVHGRTVGDVEIGDDVRLEDLGEKVPAMLIDHDGEQIDDLLDFDHADRFLVRQ